MRTIKHRLLRVGAKRAALRAGMSLFEAFLFSEKSFWHFGGCLRRLCTRACPFLGHPRFRKKAFRVLGTVFGGFARGHVPFWCIRVFGKKLSAFWGLSSAALPRVHVPFWCIRVFGKKLSVFLGLSSAALPRVHVPFWGIRVFGKKLFAFLGLSSAALRRGHVPFWGILVSGKTWLMIGNVFQNCMFLIRLGLRFAVAVVKIFP